MLIAIDIGNSRIKTGKFEKNELTEIHSFKKVGDLITFLKSDRKNDIAVSSVVPSKTKIVSDEIKNLTGKNIFVISKEIKTNLKIEYKTPETLGIDRLCSAEGAFFLFKNLEKYKNYYIGTFILSIDFGTATTINVIEHPGKFIGGLIAPGIDMMFDSLKQKTAQLPLLSISDCTSTIGNDTKSSIASGVVTSVIGMIEKTVNYLRIEEYAKEIVVYLTGGNAKKITPYLDMNFIYEEGLVLYGVNALWKLNKNG
jgi:type III pantothenate kinase